MVSRTVGSRGGVHMPVNRSFERELAQLEALSGSMPEAEGIERVRRALHHENNYLVSKAARLVADWRLVSLLPEVLAAYDRFFQNAVKTDPQCWAKNALVNALVRLECHDSGVYIRGLRHTQEEPVWGGQSDTAGSLRGTCAHALVDCKDLSDTQLLHLLLEALVDPIKTVRTEAARALGQVGGVSAYLLLKLRVLLRKEEPEVMGACFSSLLSLDRDVSGENREAMGLVAGFLDGGEEAAAEAAFALAETHDSAALATLIDRRRKSTDPWFSSILEYSIALTRLPDGLEFLLWIVEKDVRQASSALEAISRVYRSEEVRERVSMAVSRTGSERVRLAFVQHFADAEA